MQMDTGTSFNGADIQSFLRLPFHDLGSPHRKKRFRKAFVQLDTGSTATFNYMADYGFGKGGKTAKQVQVYGGGGFWGIARWGQFSWGGAFVSDAELPLNTTSENISLLIGHKSASDTPFTLDSMRLSYSMRAVDR